MQRNKNAQAQALSISIPGYILLYYSPYCSKGVSHDSSLENSALCNVWLSPWQTLETQGSILCEEDEISVVYH